MTILTTIAAADSQAASRSVLNTNLTRRHGFDIVSKATADSPYTVPATDDDKATMLNADAGHIVVNLPTAVGIDGRSYLFVRTDANSSYNVTLTPLAGSPSEEISGAADKAVGIQTAVRIMSDGANWWVVSEA